MAVEKSCQDSNRKVAFMRFLKYNAGRELMNVGRNQMTRLVPDGLKLETLGRKIKPLPTAQEGRAWEQYLWHDPDVK